MGKNVIYYGPPGTGKTYNLQKLKTEYTTYDINDQTIIDTYVREQQDWLLVTLVLLQNNGPMSNTEIQRTIDSLSFPITPALTFSTSTILASHKITPSSHFASQTPQIFRESRGMWYVDTERILAHNPIFFENYISQSNIEERFKFVTFHQSFVYEDFIEGIRPVVKNEDNDEEVDVETSDLKYTVQSGVFKEICKAAEEKPYNSYAIFIDEINRGNISAIFGELITLIEPDKRLGEKNQLEVVLPYSKKKFGVPKNLDIYGTMNSTDRSIALIDIALRRRFKFIEQSYSEEKLIAIMEERGLDASDIEGINLVEFIKYINQRIEILLDANFILGHAFFTEVSSFQELKAVVMDQVIPLLEEYFYDDLQKIQMVFSDLNEEGELKQNAIYKHKELDSLLLFEYPGEYEIEIKKSYYKNYHATREAFTKVYLG